MNDDRKLAAWLRQTLYFDVEDGTRNDEEARHVLDEVYRRRDSAVARRPRFLRRRRWGTMLCIVALGAGGAVAAAVYLSDQPVRPETGALCRAAARLDADAIALSPGIDPIDGCSVLWADGHLGVAPNGSVPPLAACVIPDGGVAVFPGDPGVCGTLGLVPANPVMSAQDKAVIALQDRLNTELNAAPCQVVPDVLHQAERIIAESHLEGWRVVIEPGSESGVCGKTAVDSPSRTVTVHEF